MKYIGTYNDVNCYACKNENFTGKSNHDCFYLVDNKVLVTWMRDDWYVIAVVDKDGYIKKITPIKHIYLNMLREEEEKKEEHKKLELKGLEEEKEKTVDGILYEAVHNNIYEEVIKF